MPGRSACSTVRTARRISSPHDDIDDVLRRRLGGALQLQPHRRAADRPEARVGAPDGGEAGLHPSNIHDNAYAIGAIDFTGDMPVILGPDGPASAASSAPSPIVAGRAVEDRPAAPRRQSPLRAPHAGRGAARRAQQDARSPRSSSAAVAPDASSRARRRRSTASSASRGERHRRASPIAGRRQVSARRIRPHRARPRAALPRPRADAAARSAQALAGIIDLTPGIRSLQIHYDSRVLAARRRCSTLSAQIEDDARRSSTTWRCHRASCTCRCRGTIRRRSSPSKNTCSRVRADAPWCPSNIEFIRRINGLDSDRRRAAHRLRRQLSRARSRRRLSRRAGGDAGRSAPPAGHDEIQSGAHLDAGERRRHRRRLHVRLWHGRPGRLSVRRPHRADVEHLSRTTASSTPASRGCCASSTRSGSIRSRPTNCPSFATDFSRASAAQDRPDAVSAVATTLPFLDGDAESIARIQVRQQAAFDAERARWQESDQSGGEWRWSAPAPDVESDAHAARRCRRRSRARCPARVEDHWSTPGRASRGGRRSDRRRIHEDGDRRLRADRAGSCSEVRCAEGRTVQLGQALVVMADAT